MFSRRYVSIWFDVRARSGFRRGWDARWYIGEKYTRDTRNQGERMEEVYEERRGTFWSSLT